MHSRRGRDREVGKMRDGQARREGLLEGERRRSSKQQAEKRGQVQMEKNTNNRRAGYHEDPFVGGQCHIPAWAENHNKPF